jgi:NAD-dependent deacetylase
MKIIALTGAGVSKASGIPTFEESGDIRNYLTRTYCEEHPADFYKILLDMYANIKDAQPNDAHKALADYNIPIVTMNIDNLHQKAGSKEVIELHGDMKEVWCYNCYGKSFPFEQLEKSICCPECGEILVHNTVLYEDSIHYLDKALHLAREANVLLVIGVSGYTSTGYFVIEEVRKYGGKVIEINQKAEYRVRPVLESYLGGK